MNRVVVVLIFPLIISCRSTQNLKETAAEPLNCEFINMVWGLGKTEREAKSNMQLQASQLRGNIIFLGWPSYFDEHREEKSIIEMAANMAPDHHPELNLNYISYGAVFKCH